MEHLPDGSAGVGDPSAGVSGGSRAGRVIKQEGDEGAPGDGAGGQTWSQKEELRSAMFTERSLITNSGID